MKTKINVFALVLIFGISTSSVLAQKEGHRERKVKFSIEIDPATFAFKGYSAHLRVQPGTSNHLLYGLGIYAMDMPSFFVNMNKINADKGWNVRIDQGIGFFAEYHFVEVNKGLFVGSQLSRQVFRIEHQDFTGHEKFTNTLLMGYGGYTVQPFSFPIYFKAWGGVGYTSKIAGENGLGEQEYNISPVSIFATLHVGYTF